MHSIWQSVDPPTHSLTDFDVGVSVKELEALFEAPQATVDALKKPAARLAGDVLKNQN